MSDTVTIWVSVQDRPLLSDAEYIAEAQAQAKADGAGTCCPWCTHSLESADRYKGGGGAIGGFAYWDCFKEEIAHDAGYQSVRAVYLAITAEHDKRRVATNDQ